MELHKLRFVVGMWGDCFWSASFHDFRDFLVRHAKDSSYDMDAEPTFRLLSERPKWLQKPLGDDLFSIRPGLPLNGGYITPLDWTEAEFAAALTELDEWHAAQVKAAS